ncbi:conserved hypothetical protein [Bradyrhizobium sp. ORS 375]|nr:conserved hypothetical protein [Bradyrhizobium sp. ORS 375]
MPSMCFSVMPGLDPGIHVHPHATSNVDGRVKPGHDEEERGGTKVPCALLHGAVVRAACGRLSPIPRAR